VVFVGVVEFAGMVASGQSKSTDPRIGQRRVATKAEHIPVGVLESQVSTGTCLNIMLFFFAKTQV
jgi:hypothetical protein